MSFLFAYGSLLSPESASRTLMRPITISDLVMTRIRGYKRTWTAPTDVIIADGDLESVRTALFLDLSAHSGSHCNGALLRISDNEWERLDLREISYDRIEIEAELDHRSIPAFTYVAPLERKASEGIVLSRYVELIEQALELYPKEFACEFWRTTANANLHLVHGTYRFSDHQQNEAAGR
jgi:gamma-glutamylcyclotransferase (GGCT)/AIG2-like uncharacterized protein YtfP